MERIISLLAKELNQKAEYIKNVIDLIGRYSIQTTSK